MFKEARKGNDSDGFLLYDKKRLLSRFISITSIYYTV